MNIDKLTPDELIDLMEFDYRLEQCKQYQVPVVSITASDLATLLPRHQISLAQRARQKVMTLAIVTGFALMIIVSLFEAARGA